MPYDTATTLGLIAALIGTVLLYIFILPKRMNGSFKNVFLQFLHDLFHFKQLFLEAIMKFLYVLSTLLCICTGFFMLFSVVEYGYNRSQSLATTGLLLMILGPIIIRIVYEAMLMGILLVQNVIDINKKLGGTHKDPAPARKDPYTKPYNSGYGAAAGYNGGNAYSGSAYGSNAAGNSNAYAGNAVGNNNAYGGNAAGNSNAYAGNAAGNSNYNNAAGNGNYNGNYGNYQGGSQY